MHRLHELVARPSSRPRPAPELSFAGSRPTDPRSNTDLLTASPRLRSAATLFALWLVVFTSASQTIIITPILPLIGEALGVPVGRLGLLVTAYAYVLALAALVMGPVSDRIGRRRVLVLGSAVLAGALALHGLAHTFEALLAVRVLAGAGGGMLSGAAVSYIGDAFPYERRGWATGWVMSGVPAGLVLGIPIGRMLAAGLGFEAPFVAFAVVMAAAFVLVLVAVPQPAVALSAERPTLAGTLRLYAGFWTRPGTAAASASFFVMYLGLGLIVVFLPQWLTERFAMEITWGGRPLTFLGLPVDFIATLFFAGGLVSLLVGPRAGALSDRTGRKPLILISCAGLAVVTVLLTVVVTERWLAYVAYIGLLGLFSLRMSPFQALLTALVPPSERGSFLAMTIAVGQIGTGTGATLGGLLYAGYGYGANTIASALTMVAMAWLVWRYVPEPTGQAAEVGSAPALAPARP